MLNLSFQFFRLDMDTTHHELESLLESEEQNYDMFIEALGEKRRRDADKLAPPTSSEPLPGPASATLPVPPPSKRIHAPPAHLPLNGKVESMAPIAKSVESNGFFSRNKPAAAQPSTR
jgi:hypothetical protein